MPYFNELKQDIENRDLSALINSLQSFPGRAANYVKSRISIPTSIPVRLCIELTNRCNLNCPFCLVGQQDTKESTAHHEQDRYMGGMDFELCKKIIRNASEFGIREINLTFQGEPLLYKRKWFPELVQLCKRYGMKPVVYTNGLLLGPDYSREILEAGLEEIRFSVDGVTQEVYELNRVGGKFARVYQNMRDMVGIAEKAQSNIKLIWQFIAMRNNEHQIEQARIMASEIGMTFEVKTFAESVPALAAENVKYRRKLKSLPCTDIYRQAMVYWNGDVVPCCYDLEGEEIMGNLKDNTMEEIWNGEKYRYFRKRLKNSVLSSQKQPDLCKGCLKYSVSPELKNNLAAKFRTLISYSFLK